MSSAPRISHPPVLRGRDEEQQAVRRLLDGARAGTGGALTLLGGAGIGKTALLDLAVAEAGDLTVLRAAGVEPESGIPYAGLHGLLRPLGRERAALPPARARVLGRALELGVAAPGLALPAAVLDLLSAAAAAGPVLACVDDAHHLDPASLAALCFAARRLAGEPIALLLASREEHPALGGVPARTLHPLCPADARDLAADLTAGVLTEDLHAALDRIAGGNPLALRELTGALTPAQLAGTAAPPDTLPRGGRLWRAHDGRLARLPGRTRHLLLLAAAAPGMDAATLLRAAGPRYATVLEEAERAGLLSATGQGYAFAEPGMRAVV
ncbi:AAA family ATPase, partial [Sphaerisporangium aureirubrum]|uniref:AAA family ATPase n=1 Tax=Sphaerisporangium aureirubrum TaxID=1544736 RepID=UPI00363A8932